MNTTHLIYSICLGGSLLLSSCYKDLGSYDYHFSDLNSIDSISFVPAAIETVSGPTVEFQQPLQDTEKKRVEVKLQQSLADNFDNLDFSWIRTYQNDKGTTVKDTMHTRGYVEVELPAGKTIQYNMLLEIRDKTTDLAKYTSLVVKTRPIFQNSLFVLHQQNGETHLGNIETIGAETNVREDAYKTVYPTVTGNPFSTAVALGFSTYYELGRNYQGYRQMLCSFNRNGEGTIYNAFGLEARNDLGNKYVMPLSQSSAPFIPKLLTASGNGANTGNSTGYHQLLISNDGRFYTSNQYLSYQIPDKDVQDDPNNLSYTDYQVTAGTVLESYNVLWDKKGNRFIYQQKTNNYGYDETMARDQSYMNNPVLDAGVSFADLDEGLSPVGKEAVYAYAPYRENFENAHAFFIFKDNSTGKYYRYELTPGQSKNDKSKSSGTKDKGDGGGTTFTITGKELLSFTPGNIKTILYDAWFSTDYLFYAIDGNLYRYNAANGDNTLIYTAPSGYTIAVVKPRSYDSNAYAGDLGRYLCLGMNNGTKGAVAEVKLTTAGDLETVYPSSTTVYEGFGNIIDLQFAREYAYQLPDYSK